jgi:hypothetical protein
VTEVAEARNDCLNGAIDVARQLLKRNKQFNPFAVSYEQDGGQVIHDVGETADSLKRIELLQELLKERRTQCVTTAVCADVLVIDPRSQQKTDAVHVHLESSDGYAGNIYLPYHKGFFKVHFGDVFALKAEPVVFAQ